jgi:aspartyl/asparaginyl-tRNA synthetase
MQDFFGYNDAVRKLRYFFQNMKGFVEVPAQSRLSILAACEDPTTIGRFDFDGIAYPLPQTGQMWLEAELLENPGIPGVFCITTSYRNEANPIPGRHQKIFPMFEFEAAGTRDDLRRIEAELMEFLGFRLPVQKKYEELARQYGVTELKADHELRMQQEYGNVISLEYFPQSTHPFWNMKQNESGTFNKIDLIVCGVETIGSAERETDTARMRHNFHHISNGKYAQLLFENFGKERVMQELDAYLSLPMFPRFGAGIGVTRLVQGMKTERLLSESEPRLSQMPVFQSTEWRASAFI